MSWHNLLGHDDVVAQFRRAIARGRLASTFLFVGLPGIGKRTFGLKLAQALLCERHPESQLDPCEACPACLQVRALSHPDVEVVARPADKAFIPLDLLIGEKERRMREGLCYNISSKPYSGRRKIAIIDDADYLNNEGANCLLKTLEEPPPKSILILIGTSEQRQLPTIRSRCQIVRFRPLADAAVAELLLAEGTCATGDEAQQAAAWGAGSLARARQGASADFRDFRGQLLEILSQSEPELLPNAKFVSSFVEAAGKDSAAKRARLREVIAMAEEFYRQVMQASAGNPPGGDSALATPLNAALHWWPAGSEAAAACLDHCLAAYAHIDSNVGQANFVEWWLDELATISRTGRMSMS
jgi:DNA polymerase-3 subunit delta'